MSNVTPATTNVLPDLLLQLISSPLIGLFGPIQHC